MFHCSPLIRKNVFLALIMIKITIIIIFIEEILFFSPKGFFVAVLYCFMNVEVQTEMGRAVHCGKWFKRRSTRHCTSCAHESSAKVSNSHDFTSQRSPGLDQSEMCRRQWMKRHRQGSPSNTNCNLRGAYVKEITPGWESEVFHPGRKRSFSGQWNHYRG